MQFVAFIDGTVEGTNVNYIDKQQNTDHTYFGNGCSNPYGTDGDQGSTTACSSNLTSTGDSKVQSMGVYYNYQAAVSGSGPTTNVDNVNASDTFCPLGWQLPYGGSGGDYYNQSKSWRYLLTAYNYVISAGTMNNPDAPKVAKYPFSFIYGGSFSWAVGVLYQLGLRGDYRDMTNRGASNAYSLLLGPTYMFSYDTGQKLHGRSIRCYRQLRRRHGGRNTRRPNKFQRFKC